MFVIITYYKKFSPLSTKPATPVVAKRLSTIQYSSRYSFKSLTFPFLYYMPRRLDSIKYIGRVAKFGV